MHRKLLATLLAIGVGTMAQADGRISDRAEFMALVKGKSLRLPLYGVNLKVSEAGKITGKGFGKSVSGDWRWTGGYFCRSLIVGSKDQGDNCQLVEKEGNRLRFTSDKGAGQTALFRLD